MKSAFEVNWCKSGPSHSWIKRKSFDFLSTNFYFVFVFIYLLSLAIIGTLTIVIFLSIKLLYFIAVIEYPRLSVSILSTYKFLFKEQYENALWLFHEICCFPLHNFDALSINVSYRNNNSFSCMDILDSSHKRIGKGRGGSYDQKSSPGATNSYDGRSYVNTNAAGTGGLSRWVVIAHLLYLYFLDLCLFCRYVWVYFTLNLYILA